MVLGLKSVASIESGGPHRTAVFFSHGLKDRIKKLKKYKDRYDELLEEK
jgi:hypothetical protein